MTTTADQVHKSRWGFNSCSYEDYLRLKEAHGLLLRAYCDCKSYIRWHNKEPQNRNRPEPSAPLDFIKHGYHRLNEKTFYGMGFRKHYGNNLYLHVLKQYRQAKRVYESAVEVESIDIPIDLDSIVAELKKHYAM